MTTAEQLDEFAIIDLFGGAFPSSAAGLPLGIGDDASIVDLGSGQVLAVSCDLLVEDIHFELDTTPASDLGFKALAVNLSDLAAMGAEPLLAWLMVALPENTSQRFLEDFNRGLVECARRYRVVLAGGDTSASPRGLTVGLTVAGRGREGRLVTRSGGRVGDVVVLGKPIGAAAAGLALVQGRISLNEAQARAARQALLRPRPQVELGRLLAEQGLARAMIDVSDGVVQDLGHVCRASGCGAIIDVEQLPLATPVADCARQLGCDPVEFALSGGEDYSLLFCLAAPDVPAVSRLVGQELGCEIHPIGSLDGGPGVRLRRGRHIGKAAVGGYRHFSQGKKGKD